MVAHLLTCSPAETVVKGSILPWGGLKKITWTQPKLVTMEVKVAYVILTRSPTDCCLVCKIMPKSMEEVL